MMEDGYILFYNKTNRAVQENIVKIPHEKKLHVKNVVNKAEKGERTKTGNNNRIKNRRGEDEEDGISH